MPKLLAAVLAVLALALCAVSCATERSEPGFIFRSVTVIDVQQCGDLFPVKDEDEKEDDS